MESSCVRFPILIVCSLLSVQLDRFASIRIPGSKKERQPLSHSKHNTNDWSISSSSTSHQFEELSSKITSEKEILALFEKMMVCCFLIVRYHKCKTFDGRATTGSECLRFG